ncbi:50S ribosomal protein L28 [Mycoplasmoides genitalium]|uniref:Large ribosomal subunit protein bL28 n=2 Tax=Mycoplasmoides genitalium TaxID=2097 RepID=RL28_MYCGE|nr:50S ribosomal protein L28 [Mycoplasmoides genitalium]P47665.1 RecName: Full=Large ribosomal subunit protein bL28; AltName: Full=50S ribosomal protein L28 [Mycoplasmoides genitalium G37]ABY79494.1 ribosomal protein L28 [synthetic Mycoplasma genitalium JCVI-1.0]AAC72447.1 ribosomal protein L28 [Mycoplasmoides genitalium G37]AFQ03265.1 50S ribosomal protein L28 [Mycoplasmoides genitalium M2321]AFQ03750.1 50S ribosomal protein L28 [Mycoplasmoides genitalium M6282]AFQ04259.1 50S ribosomal prote
MAKKDQLTLRGPLYGNNRSHSKTITRRKWNVNLQSCKIKDTNGKVTRILVSTKTIRTLKKQNRF